MLHIPRFPASGEARDMEHAVTSPALRACRINKKRNLSVGFADSFPRGGAGTTPKGGPAAACTAAEPCIWPEKERFL